MPTRGGSYIQLPKFIASKKACINIKNENDDNCFKYSVQCGYYRIYENAFRTSGPLQEARGHTKLGRVAFPPGETRNNNEKNNNISIHVFRLNDEET